MMSEDADCRVCQGPAECCLRVSRWCPFVFVIVIVLWSYYAYVLEFCVLTVETTFEKPIYLSVFHFLFILLWVAYYRTSFAQPGEIPDSFRLLASEITAQHGVMNEQLEEFVRNDDVKMRTPTGEIRYCEICHIVKPDRAHHCTACGRCILKMDHHCPWINNCVGFTNYKFFILFLLYAVLYCFFVGSTTLTYCVKFWKQQAQGTNKWHVYFVFMLSVMFLISIMPLLCYHCYLLLENRTTLEAYRAPVFLHGVDKDGFNLGRSKNFREVFGENCFLWFLPVASTPGDGVNFPLRIRNSGRRYNAMERSENSFKHKQSSVR